MNKNLFQDLWFKVFKSGNPLFLYIGINVLIFLLVAIINVPVFLSGNGGDGIGWMIREYFGLPAALERIPLRFYTILTYQFFHDGLLHVLFNMLWLYWMGQIFLDFLKPRQFHFVYWFGSFAGAILYILAYNIFPVFEPTLKGATIIGSSAAVMGIIVATATLLPDFSIRLLFLGNVKLKYLAIAYVVLDIIGVASTNAGGSFAHIGGAILGFAYVKALQGGSDWSNIFKKKQNMKVVKNEKARPRSKNKENIPNQKEIDAILDKISKAGYDKLSKEEKEILFKASKD